MHVRFPIHTGNYHVAVSLEQKEKITANLSRHVMSYLQRRQYARAETGLLRGRCAGGRRTSRYLTAGYLLVKVLYVANAVGQFFILDALLGTDFHSFGIDIILALVEGKGTGESEIFPRVTLCDFHVRRYGRNNHRYTIECVLPINLFNEKVFAFLWCWLLFVSIVSFVSVCNWTRKFFSSQYRVSYVRKFLNAPAETGQVSEFAQEYIGGDGIFAFKVLSENSSDMLLHELINSLWGHFQDDKRKYVQSPYFESNP